MRNIENLQELENFQLKYELTSGLPVPLDYLIENQVFGFYRNQQLIAGFVLASNERLRTIDVFSSPLNKDALYTDLGSNKFCEVCCFWIEKEKRKNMLFNAWCWIRMAYKVKIQSEPFILFGTNSQGLASLYAYPKEESLLYHIDQVSGKRTFIFIARRSDFVIGVRKIILSKLWSMKYPDRIKVDIQLKKCILQEMGSTINKYGR